MQIPRHELDKIAQHYFDNQYSRQILAESRSKLHAGRLELIQQAEMEESALLLEFQSTPGNRTKAINQLLAHHGQPPIQMGSHEGNYLRDKLYHADIQLAELTVEQVREGGVPLPKPPFSPPFYWEKIAGFAAPMAETNLGSAGHISVSEMVTKFCDHKVSKGKWRATSRADYEGNLRLFAEFVGPDRPLHTLTPHDLTSYEQAITRMPRNMSKLPKYRKMTLAEAAKVSKDAEVVTPQTASKHYENARLMLAHAVMTFYLKTTPAPDLRRDVSYEKEERPPFTEAQLRQLFASAEFNDRRYYKKSGRFWVPVLGPYSGARLNELVGLEVRDVITMDGIVYLNIRPNSFRNIKNKTSARLVPIHAEVIEAGFMDYVALLRRRNQEMLFPDLTKAPMASDSMSKRFDRILKEVKLKVKGQRNSLCFHSLRHTFNTQLLAKGVNREHRMALMGHSMGDSNADYIHLYPVHITSPELAKIDYGFKLNELLVPPQK